MAFLDDFEAGRVAGASAPDARQRALIGDWVTTRPAALFDELLASRPVWRVGTFAFLTRHAEVRAMLDAAAPFSVAPYAERIRRLNGGADFLLGLDDGPDYRRELARLRGVFVPDDAARVRAVVEAQATATVAAAQRVGQLELTDGFARPAACRLASDYFGLVGVEPDVLAAWARAIFFDAFVNVVGVPLFTRRAARASAALRAHLDEVVAAAKHRDAARPPAAVTVLDRLLAAQASGDAVLTDGHIRDLLLWCTAGMIDNVNTAVCSAIDRLLDEPDARDGAAAAARAGDDDQLWRYVQEALRFRTPTPVVTRRATADVTVGQGTRDETRIPAGSLVFAGLGAAMRDPAVVDEPSAFRLDRPDEHYLHFGVGLHACLGVHLARMLVTTLVGTVLCGEGLARGPGLSGRYRDAGPFPKRMVVRFNAR